MSLATAVPAPGVLADRLPRSAWLSAVLVVLGAALTAAAAQLVVPLWPVPITGQTFAVLLVGAALGPWRAFASLALYAAAGAAGLPVFSNGGHGWLALAGPTGGYLVAFPVAALVVGLLARRGWDRSIATTFAAFAIGSAVVYAIALPWLAAYLAASGAPATPERTLELGMYPFLLGDAVKAVLAGLALPAAWRLADPRTRTGRGDQPD